MKIGIFTYGTRGDVQPYLPLALELMTRGHQVVCCAPENFRSLVEEQGIDFFPLHGDAEALMHTPEGQKVLDTGNSVQLMQFFFKALRSIREPLLESYKKGMELAEVVIANAATLPLLHAVAEFQQKPFAITYFMPPLVPTRHFPVADLAFINWSYYNLFTYWLVRFAYWKIVKEDVQAARKQLGLQPLKKNLIHYIDSKKPLDLYCFSPALLPAPPDWEPHHQVTGFMRLPMHTSNSGLPQQEEKKLLQWLQSGTPPIYMGFGSNGIGKRIPVSALLNAILEKTNERILFCTGWSGLENLPQHSRLCVLKSVNHDFIFPHCKLGIFHGGAGTLCSMIHHQLPMIVLSLYTDQPFWGRLVEAQGVGVHLPLRELTSAKLLHALHVVQQPEYAARVSVMARKVIAENGTKKAAELIEEYFKGRIIDFTTAP